MAPSGRRRAKSTKNPRRTQIKKLVDKSKKQEKSAISPIKNSDNLLKITKNQENSATISPIKNSDNLLKITKNQENSAAISPIKDSENNLLKIEGGDFTSDMGCSTPKGKRFRLPEIVTCPPAPMKRRMLTNCSLRRTPIAFFAPPDIELFFVYALGRDVSA